MTEFTEVREATVKWLDAIDPTEKCALLLSRSEIGLLNACLASHLDLIKGDDENVEAAELYELIRKKVTAVMEVSGYTETP